MLKMGKVQKKHQLSEESIKTSIEFGHANKVASLLLRTLKPLIRNKSGRFLYNDLCSKLVTVIGTGPIKLKGKRKITDGNLTLLRGFRLNRYKYLSNLANLRPEIHISAAEKQIEISLAALNKAAFNAPSRAFKVVLSFQCILLDIVNYTVDTISIDDLEIPLNEEGIGSKQVNIPIKNTENKVVILAMGICFHLNKLNSDQSFISNNRDHLAGEILEAVYIKNGEIVRFVEPDNPEEINEVASGEIKKISWIDVE